MITQILMLALTIVVLLAIDYYFFVAVKFVFRKKNIRVKKFINYSYWAWVILVMLLIMAFNLSSAHSVGPIPRSYIMVVVFMHYLSKIFGVVFLMMEDILRFFKWTFLKIKGSLRNHPADNTPGHGYKISRADFLAKTTLLAGTLPLVTMSYGIISGAHDYRIRRKTIFLKNLPKSFDGILIGQISDIHSGSFFNKTAVRGGVEMMMAEKPDIVFFTGDLVNNEAQEVQGYIGIFDKIKAPLGVYSVLGNHDYGEYKQWGSEAAKSKNFQDMLEAHKALGWKLLMNENHIIEQGGEKLAVIGIENWGMGRFPKYGKMETAVQGTGEAAVKLLLSHDPSHWDGQVRQQYSDVDVMFAGHTHGFQFGVEWGDIKWSPSQYVYKQWAGLYQTGDQHLYVNRGFGYIGYPGRIGIPPEITMVTLKRA